MSEQTKSTGPETSAFTDAAYVTVTELEVSLGANLRAQRLDRNLERSILAERAGVSLSALKRLESGHGSTTHTLLRILRALGREDWLKTIAPVATINPLTMPKSAAPRRRATGRRKR